MDINLFDYDLPKELIAQTPLKVRDSSRLLIMDKSSGELKHEYKIYCKRLCINMEFIISSFHFR